jgi:hypothetical protein
VLAGSQIRARAARNDDCSVSVSVSVFADELSS